MSAETDKIFGAPWLVEDWQRAPEIRLLPQSDRCAEEARYEDQGFGIYIHDISGDPPMPKRCCRRADFETPGHRRLCWMHWRVLDEPICSCGHDAHDHQERAGWGPAFGGGCNWQDPWKPRRCDRGPMVAKSTGPYAQHGMAHCRCEQYEPAWGRSLAER